MSKDWQIENFPDVRNNQLHIDGVSAVELANAHGTPLFVFSERRIRHNIDRLKRAGQVIDRPLKLCYAAKAMSTIGILRAVKDADCDIEVNSGGELYKALEAGFRGDQIIFNGTSKEIWELEGAIDAEIYAIQVDSVVELAMIEETAKRLSKRANVSLRLVPEIESATHHGLQTALLTSKFGMMPDEALECFRQYKDSPHIDLAGIHLHIGSQNPSPGAYAEALEVLFVNLHKIYNETGLALSHINLGGGFPVNYVANDEVANSFTDDRREMLSADFEPKDAIGNAWQTMRRAAESANAAHLLENITLLLEPGRSIIADAGVLLTSVRNIKQRPIARTEECDNRPLTTDHWLLTDAGFNLTLSMVTYNWYYHLVSASRAGEEHDFAYKLAGPLCDGGDVYFDIEGSGRLPSHRRLPRGVELGEILALLNCGAYTLSQASQYNSRALPAVILVRTNGEPELIRRRDELKDLLLNEIY
ncbi:MAG TPA: diaminopimelate decarboxylase [Pyrinomonadaceae bacterium]|nr:diaminopimelate decarboxylase [Pyrinomonadaceae bacterium]